MSDPTNPTNSWESAANDAVKGAENVANQGIDSAENVANNAVDSAENVANNAVDSAKNVANNAVDSAENVANNVVDSAENVANNAVNSAKNVANNAIDSAKNVANNAIDSAEAAANNAIDSVENVANNAVESAKAVVDKAKEVINALGGSTGGLPSLGGGGGVTSLVAAAAGGGALGALAGGLGGGNPLASLRSPSVSRALSVLGGGGGASRGGALSANKATILNLDGTEPSKIVCQFNPKEYTISKQNKWSSAKVQSNDDIPDIEFNGGDPMVLKVQLFFDTTADESDVGEKTKQLFDLMMVSESLTNHTTKKGRPPRVCLVWSKTPNFESVITSASQKFTLFRSDGTPLRATVDVTFQQLTKPGKYPRQNPTSGGDGGEQIWSVKTGDTLAWISYQVYGDSTRWRVIAEANRLLNVRRLTPGMTLVIPNA